MSASEERKPATKKWRDRTRTTLQGFPLSHRQCLIGASCQEGRRTSSTERQQQSTHGCRKVASVNWRIEGGRAERSNPGSSAGGQSGGSRAARTGDTGAQVGVSIPEPTFNIGSYSPPCASVIIILGISISNERQRDLLTYSPPSRPPPFPVVIGVMRGQLHVDVHSAPCVSQEDTRCV